MILAVMMVKTAKIVFGPCFDRLCGFKLLPSKSALGHSSSAFQSFCLPTHHLNFLRDPTGQLHGLKYFPENPSHSTT